MAGALLDTPRVSGDHHTLVAAPGRGGREAQQGRRELHPPHHGGERAVAQVVHYGRPPQRERSRQQSKQTPAAPESSPTGCTAPITGMGNWFVQTDYDSWFVQTDYGSWFVQTGYNNRFVQIGLYRLVIAPGCSYCFFVKLVVTIDKLVVAIDLGKQVMN